MNYLRATFTILAITAITLLVSSTKPIFAQPPEPTPVPIEPENYNDWIITDLYTAINGGARDYKHNVYLDSLPEGFPNYQGTISGWFSINVNGEPSGEGDGFIQVGLIGFYNGATWFVSADPERANSLDVECLYGHDQWEGRGCLGNIGEFGTEIDRWFTFELVSYGQGFWIARVYGSNGASHDAAKIYYASTLIHDASTTSEQSWPGSEFMSNPENTMQFYHWNPSYMIWGYGFQRWPPTESGQSWQNFATVLTNHPNIGPLDICNAVYGTEPPPINPSYPRLWYMGSGGSVCYEPIMF